MHAIRSKFIPIDHFVIGHAAPLLRLAGVVSIISGLIGGYVWLLDLADRSDGDSLRLGFWHNPFMQIAPFNEPFLDLSMWVLLACSASAGLGGLLLLVPVRWGVPLVTWPARVSIVTNGVIAFFMVATMFVFDRNRVEDFNPRGTSTALVLRLGSIAVHLMLWAFLSGKAVSGFFARQAHPPEHAFDVIMKDARSSS